MLRRDRTALDLLQLNRRVEDVDGGVHMVEVYDQLAELVLGVLDLACNLCALCNEARQNMWIGDGTTCQTYELLGGWALRKLFSKGRPGTQLARILSPGGPRRGSLRFGLQSHRLRIAT